MEDSRIIALYWNRREEAITETKNKYGSYLFTISHNILKNSEDAEECENDTYLTAWNAIPPTRPKILSAFLAKIVRNLSLNKLRDKNALKRGGKSTILSFDELSDAIPDSITFDTLQPETLAEILNAFLQTLSDEERRVFLCRYWYGDSIDEIASRFGFGKSKVKMMLSRSRDKLLHHLKKEGILV